MRQRVVHGAVIDTTTPDETERIIRHYTNKPERVTYIRAGETITLSAGGNGQDEVYKVPLGYRFQARRVFLNLSTATAPLTGNVALNAAGIYVAYLRSGAIIEYANPQSAAGIPSIPGAQSWGDQQGPVLVNGEVFEVSAVGLTANASLDVTLEGILTCPEDDKVRKHA
jgi:hypothetical protein